MEQDCSPMVAQKKAAKGARQRREEDFNDTWKTESAKNKVHKMNWVDLVDSLRLLKKMSDEIGILSSGRLQEEEVLIVFEHHMEIVEVHMEEHQFHI